MQRVPVASADGAGGVPGAHGGCISVVHVGAYLAVFACIWAVFACIWPYLAVFAVFGRIWPDLAVLGQT